MNISSAYIYGKQISSSLSPLQDNVYFDTGRFNPIYVGENFSFNDSSIHKDSFDESSWSATHDTTYINAKKVIQALGTNADPWTVQGGDLMCSQSNPFVSYNASTSMVFLPITLAKEKIIPYTTKMYALIKQSGLSSSSSADNATRMREYLTNDYYGELQSVAVVQVGPRGNTDGYVEYWSSFFPLDYMASDPTYFGIYFYGFSEVCIKKIWFTDLNTQ